MKYLCRPILRIKRAGFKVWIGGFSFSQDMATPPQKSLTSLGRGIRYGILGMSATPLIGTLLYSDTSQLPSWLGCPILHFTGIPCPTCGMTRSFLAMKQGDLSLALQFHAFGPWLGITFIVMTTHAAFELVVNRPMTTVYTRLFTRSNIQISVIFLVLVYYCWRLWLLWCDGTLSSSFAGSPLGRWLLS